MNSPRVTIVVVDELLHEKRYHFDKPAICIVGRAVDCDMTLPVDGGHRYVSRHHCLLDIQPPKVRIWDLGSTNGTFVNGEKIDARGARQHPGDTEPNEERAEGIDLYDGDEIRIGNTMLLISVEVPAEELQPAYFPPLF
jgi:eukaryotic-like serine/threonine-protein kinase